MKIPQIARSVFFRQVNGLCYVKSGYIVLDNLGVKVNFDGILEVMFYKSRPVNMRALILKKILVRAEEFLKL